MTMLMSITNNNEPNTDPCRAPNVINNDKRIYIVIIVLIVYYLIIYTIGMKYS